MNTVRREEFLHGASSNCRGAFPAEPILQKPDRRVDAEVIGRTVARCLRLRIASACHNRGIYSVYRSLLGFDHLLDEVQNLRLVVRVLNHRPKPQQLVDPGEGTPGRTLKERYRATENFGDPGQLHLSAAKLALGLVYS